MISAFMKIRVSLHLMNNIHAWEYIHDSYKLSQIRLFWIYSYSQHKCQARATRMRYECDTSYKSATRVREERHKCDMSGTLTTRMRHVWKTLILTTTRVKTYVHTFIFTIWQLKDYTKKNNFILRATFWKCLFLMPKCV